MPHHEHLHRDRPRRDLSPGPATPTLAGVGGQQPVGATVVLGRYGPIGSSLGVLIRRRECPVAALVCPVCLSTQFDDDGLRPIHGGRPA